ncbi:hypothetical protein BT67DRAFT_237836 [Trichocladium antarcticum]|uniref:Uncharacterized protein n=1 Tax=Trichocladium antarcticum TaxID=1450529 RepID=A0AAN6UP36_9PEZI|nr:hypothetical protein BT67DRAFT_237836 [Trichocladium antarcticum]
MALGRCCTVVQVMLRNMNYATYALWYTYNANIITCTYLYRCGRVSATKDASISLSNFQQPPPLHFTLPPLDPLFSIPSSRRKLPGVKLEAVQDMRPSSRPRTRIRVARANQPPFSGLDVNKYNLLPKMCGRSRLPIDPWNVSIRAWFKSVLSAIVMALPLRGGVWIHVGLHRRTGHSRIGMGSWPCLAQVGTQGRGAMDGWRDLSNGAPNKLARSDQGVSVKYRAKN